LASESNQKKENSENTQKNQKKESSVKKDEKIKKEGKDEDFKYIVRIANTDIDGNRTLVHGLACIKGIGRHMAFLIADKTGLDRNIKFGNLSDEQIEKIQQTLSDINNNAPGWMLNHQRDHKTGENIHIIGPELDIVKREEINIMKKIRCYRGIRHERGLRVRGQRTRSNSRSGLSLGVSRKSQMKK